MKKLKSYEVITQDGKSHYMAASSKEEVRLFWYDKPKKIIHRTDIDPKGHLSIDRNILSFTY